MEHATTKKFSTSRGDLAYFDLGKGKPVLLLHGFPDTPLTFSDLVAALNLSGYRCIVPFMPGYGESNLPQKPKGLFKQAEASMLGIGRMMDEFLSSCLPGETLSVIGHDWGSLLAQMLIALNDENTQPAYKIDQAVIYAVPPLGSFYQNLSIKQLIRSRYMLYFQGPGVSKRIRALNFAYISELWQRWSPWSADELAQQVQLQRTIETLKQGSCLENGMAYYRYLLNPFYLFRGSSILQQHHLLLKKRPCPCLLLVGEKDECIGAEMFQGGSEYYPHSATRLSVLENLGHFAHLENPEKVIALIKDFFAMVKQHNHQAISASRASV